MSAIRKAGVGMAAWLMIASPATAAEPEAHQPSPPQTSRSLMFSDAEVDAVAKALAALEKVRETGIAAEADQAPAEQPQKSRVPNIYVSAILDLGDGNWTVWANGYRINARQQAPEFKVVAVKDNLAEIVVDGDQPARFRLHADQTWRSAHHDIVEGIFP